MWNEPLKVWQTYASTESHTTLFHSPIGFWAVDTSTQSSYKKPSLQLRSFDCGWHQVSSCSKILKLLETTKHIRWRSHHFVWTNGSRTMTSIVGTKWALCPTTPAAWKLWVHVLQLDSWLFGTRCVKTVSKYYVQFNANGLHSGKWRGIFHTV